MQDVQGWQDRRQVSVQRAGVKGVELPWRIRQQDGQVQTVLAAVTLSVDLSHEARGTHMSRFLEVLERWQEQPHAGAALEDILTEVRRRLHATSASMDVRFRYFLPKAAPVTGQRSTMGYPCMLSGSLAGDCFDLVMGVEVPMTTLCPCSKEIAEVGAHSQRSWLRVKVRPVPGTTPWLEDLIHDLETLGSCEVYPLLKRPDEKFLTEQAYHNPKFVEDVVRDTVLALRQLPQITWFEVECEAAESIHAHNAFAYQQETVPVAIQAPSANGHDTAALTSAEVIAAR